MRKPDWSIISNYLFAESLFFLDDEVFNKEKLTEFEMVMRAMRHAYYFSSKNLYHYDQVEIFINRKRFLGSKPHEVKIKSINFEPVFIRSSPFHKRALSKTRLEGDVLSHISSNKKAFSSFEEDVFNKNC